MLCHEDKFKFITFYRSALMLAAKEEYADVVQYLLKHKAIKFYPEVDQWRSG